MPVKIKNSLLLLVTLHVLGCTHSKIETLPPEGPRHFSLQAKVNFHSSEFRFSGKLLLSYDHNRDKIIFLSPMNQVYYKLLLQGEQVVIINTRAKIFWQGSFRVLFTEMGHVDFTYAELKDLIVRGKVPGVKKEKFGLHIHIDRSGRLRQPKKIEVNGEDMSIRFKIVQRKTRQGRLAFTADINALQSANLDDVLQSANR